MTAERVLILAPRGRDAPIAQETLGRHGLSADICATLNDLIDAMRRGVGAVMATEEALASGDLTSITAFVRDQPAWSDLPFIILANGSKGPRTPAATKRLENLSNIVLLERPLHAEAMVGAVRSALRARRRQYELRDIAESLEQAVAARTQELASVQEGLEVALDAAGMGSWDLDLVTGEARRTDRHDEIFGYATPQVEWSVDRFLSHIVAERRDEIAGIFKRALRSGTLDIDCPIIAHDGSQRWITAKGRVRFDADGTPLRMSGVVADVTGQREAEEQLAQSHKMDAIGQLTGGVAHDFNNLLTPIVGSLDLLRKRHPNDDRSQRLIGGALQAAERATTLTQRLLAFARRQSLQPQAVDVGALVDGIVDLIRRSLGPTVDIRLDIPKALPSARVDPNQLELALLNLAINSRDAMPDGGQLTIAISHTTADAFPNVDVPAGSYLRLAATDTGIGMDRDTLARATEPFFSTKGVGKGTGLGLSMIHGLAAQSGGALEIESAPGKGTTAAIWLPSTDAEADHAYASARSDFSCRRSGHLLLVDDEEIVRSATAEMLRDIGFVVTEFSSGSRVLQALGDGLKADAIISDYLMPGMTGAGLISEIRSTGLRIPALLISGYTNAGEDVKGDLAMLSKPFRQADLAAKIDEIMDVGSQN